MKKMVSALLGCAVIVATLCSCSGGGNVGTYDYGTGTNGYYNNTTNGTMNRTTTNGTNRNNDVGIGGGVSGSISGGVSMNNLWNDIKTELGDNIPSAQNTSDKELSNIYGLDVNSLEEHKSYISDKDEKSDEIFLAKVKSGEMSNVESAVRARHTVLENKWKSAAKSEKAKVGGYRLITNGDYILYVVSDKADEVAKIFNDYTKDEKATKK